MSRWATAAVAALFVTVLALILAVGSFSREVRLPAPPIELTVPEPQPGPDPAPEPAPRSPTGPPAATPPDDDPGDDGRSAG